MWKVRKLFDEQVYALKQVRVLWGYCNALTRRMDREGQEALENAARRGGDAVVAAQQAHRGVLLRVDGGGVGAVRACERRQEGTLLTQDGE